MKKIQHSNDGSNHTSDIFVKLGLFQILKKTICSIQKTVMNMCALAWMGKGDCPDNKNVF